MAMKESIVIEDIDGLSSALADDKNKPLSTHTTDGSRIYRCESKGLAVLSSKFNYEVRYKFSQYLLDPLKYSAKLCAYLD